MYKNVASQAVTVLAIDTATNLPKTGDAGNITLYYNGDNGGVTVFSTSSGHPTEDDATNSPGTYTLGLSQAETNYNRLNISGKSSTTGIRVIPILNIQTVPANFPKLAVDSSAGGVLLSDAVAHGGTLGSSTATLALSRLNVTSQTANTAAITALGNGSGSGVSATGGASVTTTAAGHGILVTGGASSTSAGGVAGNAINALGGAGSASTNGAATGVKFTGGGTNTVASAAHGLDTTGASTGSGLSATSGGGATGDGFVATSVATNGRGINAVGVGTGAGVLTTGGATGHGMALVGGGTSGDGLNITTTLGHGINSAPTGSAKHGILATGGSTGTSHGVSFVGGTLGGHGLNATGGASGTNGINASGTSGVGINASGGNSGIKATSTSAGANPGIDVVAAATGPGIRTTGGAASGVTAAGTGILSVGGAASTSAGGVASPGLVVTGGAGAASTNGAASGATITGGGTNTVASTAHGLSVTGTSTGNGLLATSGGGATGNGIGATAASTNGSGLACVSTGTGSGILTDKLTASAAVAFQSTFIVTTSTALGALSCSTLTASGAVAFQSTFAVTTSTALGALSASTVTFSGAVAFQSTFAVTTSTALGAISGSTLTLSGAVAFQSTFVVTGATTLTGAVTATNAGNDIRGITLTTSPPTAAAIATAVWQDATAGDFTTAGSIGKSLGGAFTSLGTSVYSVAALANAPTGGSAPTVGQIATAVWQDLTASSDFTTTGSIGKLLAALTFTVSNQLDVNVLSTAGTTVYNSDGTCANGSGSSSVFKFPTTDSAGNAISDSSQYQWTALRIVGGTGIGQVVNLTTATGTAREYTILSGTAPATVDNTSTYVILGTWRANTTHYAGTATVSGAIPAFAAGANGGLPVLSSSGTTLAYTVSTLTTYTGNTPQTGDAYARIGAAGAGLTAVTLGSAGLDSVVIESGLNARQATSLIASACVGVLAGAATTTVTIKGAGVATQRVSATVTSDGNRTAVALTPPA